jgi:hypothetical protein
MKQIQNQSSQSEMAQYFKKYNFEILPVHGVMPHGHCTCGTNDCPNTGKHPIPWSWDKDGKGCFQNLGEIQSFYEINPYANYGVLTSGIVGMDFDAKKGGLESYQKFIEPYLKDITTLRVHSGSGGGSMHIYFSDINKEFKNATEILPGIDIRGYGGFLVGPGCIHKSLNRYEIYDNNDLTSEGPRIAELPEELKQFLKSDLLPSAKKNKKNEIHALLAFGGGVKVGSRNDTLTSHGGTLIQKNYSDDEIKQSLIELNNKFDEPLELSEVLNIWKSILRYKVDIDSSPQPLFREAKKPKDFPLQALGKRLFYAAMALKKSVQAPDALIGQSLLGAAAMATQAHIDVVADGRCYPTSLALISVAPSGERKSSVDKEALHSHYAVEKEQIQKYEQELKVFKKKEEDYLLHKRVSNNKKDPKQIPLPRIDPPVPPRSEISFMEEPTYEAIVKAFPNGRPSMGLFSDEGGRFAGGHAMNSDNFLKTITGLSSLWDGKPISRSRGTEGTSKLFGKRLSLHLMFQPRVSKLFTSNEVISDQGFLSRCLIVSPESNIGNRLYKAVDLNSDSDILEYRALMKKIFSMPLPCLPGTNDLSPRQIALNSEDRDLWISFHDSIEVKQKENNELYSIRGFASKAAEQVLRISAILTFIDDQNATHITRYSLESAIELVEYYLSEALRLHNDSVIDPDLLLADKLLKWCQQFSEVYLVQIYQNGPNAVRSKTVAQKLIQILESHNWLKKIDGEKLIDGKNRRAVWGVVKCE